MPLAKTFSNYCYKLAKDPGNMWLITGTVGWVLSAIAQVTAVVINKKIPSDQKKFLIPQETADAIINISSFFVFTRYTGKVGDKLVSTGKLATPKIRKFLADSKLSECVGKLGSYVVDGVKKDGGFDISKLSAIANPGTDAEKALSKHYFKFADGVGFVASVTGSIISGNIITPIFRNKVAAHRQKQAIARDNMSQNQDTVKSPVTPVQGAYSMDAYKTKATSGSIRI